ILKIKYFILIFMIIMFSLFICNFEAFTSNQNLESFEYFTFSSISLLSLFGSVALYISSFFISEKPIIELEKPSRYKSRKGSIELGKVMKKKRKIYKFFLSLKDLERHMFVCGATGTGKSNFLQYFLINLKKSYDIPFLLVEFKGEYIFLQDIIEDLLVIRPGENFSINIFNPEGANPEIHAERIFDILKSGQFLDEHIEFSPQMQKVLVDILTKVCSNPQIQSWNGFYNQCEIYLEDQKNAIPMVHQTLISIKNRIRRFSIGPLKAVFANRYKLKIKELFEKNILIDLSSIIRLGGEKEDALFFLNMILKYLWDKNLTYGAYNFQGIKHITIVEDAQYFAPKDISSQTKITSYLEDIALLQRGTGECLISIATRPNVSEEILANCGVLVTFKNYMAKEFLSKLLSLSEEQEEYLSYLEEGQCIVRVNSIKKPFVLGIPYIERHWLKRGDVNRKNRSILKKFKEKYKEKTEKQNSDENIEESKKSSQKSHNIQEIDEKFKALAEMKYFVDNLDIKDVVSMDPFNPENYVKCDECNSIIEKKDKNCPFCGVRLNR
ncbi:MAG: helicase HerA domain-containing protein, partial [Candidatus Odinarchaeota archaeon]